MKPPLFIRRLRCVAALTVGALACFALAPDARAAAAATNAPAKPAPAAITANDKSGKAGKTAAPEPAPTNAPPKKVEIPKSAFHDELGVGKDPFFPSSPRRGPRPLPTPPGTEPPVVTPPVPEVVVPAPQPPPRETAASAQFSVKGIFLGKKRSAVIHTGSNTYDFFLGDHFAVRAGTNVLRVQCLDIGERTVTIKVDGEKEPRELRLRPDL